MRKRPAPPTRPYHHGDLRRALIAAALDLVTEKQDWTFSLREVARRAGVSHNAPYSHFAEKQDLLAAVAAAGFEVLRDRMRSAVAGLQAADAALIASGRAYVDFALENPARYRLMFGPELAKAAGGRPAEARAAGDEARAVLIDIIRAGARSGVFAIPSDDPRDIEIAVLSAWSVVHGLTLLLLDNLREGTAAADDVIEGVQQTLLRGLKSAPSSRAPPARRRAQRDRGRER